VNILDEFFPEAGAFYVFDRGYIDFERLFMFTLCSAFFVYVPKRMSCCSGATPFRWSRPQACDPITLSYWPRSIPQKLIPIVVRENSAGFKINKIR